MENLSKIKVNNINSSDELLDIVDANDNFICTKLRSEVYKTSSAVYQRKLFFRAINAIIVNNEGKLFIPRRSGSKKIFPLGLDASCGGHVSSGETYHQAFKREVEEELNLNIDNLNWKLKGFMSPIKHGSFSFSNIYEIKLDQTPKYNKNDFVEHYWMYPKEFLQKINNGETAKGDLIIIVKNFFNKG